MRQLFLCLPLLASVACVCGTPAQDPDAGLLADGGEDGGGGGGGTVQSSCELSDDAGEPSYGYYAALSGAEVVPPTSAPAAPSNVDLLINNVRSGFRYFLPTLPPGVTAVHIHRAPLGMNGPVEFELKGSTGNAFFGPGQLSALEAGYSYVDVHTAANPEGELRGQLVSSREDVFVAPLSGYETVPPHKSGAGGVAGFIVDSWGGKLRYAYSSDVPATSVQLHRGVAGAEGPPIMPMGSGPTGCGRGTLTLLEAARLEQGLWYVAVATASRPGGELRGQLRRPGETLFVAKLTPKQAVPPANASSTGRGMLFQRPYWNESRYYLETTATVAAAHLHNGHGGANGAALFSMSPQIQPMSGGENLGAAGVQALAGGLLYFDVHTAVYPGGELRGQLIRPGETLYLAQLSGGQEVPANGSLAQGAIAVILSADGTSISYAGTHGVSGATAAYFQVGASGSNGPEAFPIALAGSSVGGKQSVTAADVDNLNGVLWYANVRSPAYPEGEIRGNLVKQ